MRKILVVLSGLWLLLNTCAQYTVHTGSLSPLRVEGATDAETAAVKAATDLLKRLLPTHSENVVFEFVPGEKGKDAFEIESKNGKIMIRGNNGVSMASGLNWYLKYYCHCHVALNANGDRLNLPEPLPQLKNKLRLSSPFKYRNFFNYCTFSYTMAWWDWPRWERMIDYMALNGINMPLAITGQEGVWQEVLRELGFEDQQIRDFLGGPAYLPWKWMGNIEGLAGPLPQFWIDGHVQLQQEILARERALGMTPILQGFSGHIPATIKEIFPRAVIHQSTSWAGMPGTWFLQPQDPLFQRIGQSFIREQTRLFGTDHLYDVDCFNEINPPTRDLAFIGDVGKSVYKAMQAVDSEAIWVFQGWFLFWQSDFWKTPQARALLDAVPDDRMVGLDLYAEAQSVWNKTDGFYGKPWIWNVLCNQSQKVNMGGDLETMQTNLAEAMNSPRRGKLQGIGMMMEGLGYNPVIQELMLEKAWAPEPVDINTWVAAYARRRYGSDDPRLSGAWQLLLKGPYSRNISNGGETIICSIPGLNRFVPTDSDRFGIAYDALTVVKACQLLLACSGRLRASTSYRFDVAHVTREMLNNLANLFTANITRAYQDEDEKALSEHSERFLQLIRDLDRLLGSDEHFLLGKWIASARKWGTSKEEKNFYEGNARALLTLWEPAKKSQLRDYASRQWNGLLRDFYLGRWKLLLDRLASSLRDKIPLDRKKFLNDLKDFEFQWIRQNHGNYPSTPVGDTLEIAQRLFDKYISYYQEAKPAKKVK